MIVLVTGGYGFIGSFVAERFYKEGHKVYIIDNLSTGQKTNLSIPHKFYQLNVEDPKCEAVFQSVSPDIVVHLAAQVDVATSVHHPHLDTQSNIAGLVNMLRCAKKSGASKFIFASSAAVYGTNDAEILREDDECNPVSPYGINKKLGEYYCEKWQEIYGLQTLCFRFSNVYGPRQGQYGEGGVVSTFIEQICGGKELTIFGDGEQTRDFLFVRDVAEAVYRGAASGVTGVYNLSSNTVTSVNDLVDILGKIAGNAKVRYSQPRAGDILHSRLDNARVKRDLDWVPLYSLEEGLKQTFEWFEQSKTPKSSQPTTVKNGSGKWWRTVKPYAENALAFALVAVLANTDFMFRSNIDFNLIYIIVLGVIYGMRQSILASVLASVLYFYDGLSNGREWVSLLYDPEALFNVAVYLFFGFVVGFVADRNKRENSQTKHELTIAEEKYEFLKEIYVDTKNVKEELQRQLINSKDSIGRIYGIIKKLESLEPEEVVTSSVSVMAEIMDTDRISVYSVNNSDYLRLMIHSSAVKFNLPRTMRISEHPHLREVIEGGRLFVNKEMAPDLPMLVAPVRYENRTVALISIHEPSFEKLNMNYENLFKVCTDLISGSLSRAFNYVGVTRNERFVGDTGVLKASVFLQVLESKAQARKQFSTDYVLLGVENKEQQLKPIADRVSSSLRDSDYMGLIKDDIVLLLSNSNPSEADRVVERLRRNGIHTRIMREEEVYG